jgi:hypothetical protein
MDSQGAPKLGQVEAKLRQIYLLNSINHNPLRLKTTFRKKVSAIVCLPRIPAKWWPGKIVEYENVMGWINSTSKVKFVIDYRSRMR